jgi:hypothetical protein
MNTIVCPHCKKPLEISEALMHQLKEEVLEAERKKHLKEIEEARKEAAGKVLTELKILREESERKDQELKAAREAELVIRKQKNQLEEQKRAFELEKQRQLDAERAKIREKAMEEMAEKQHFKEKEYEQKIDSLKKSLEDAQRKAQQGSQQLQGEVQELDLEQMFRQTFPQDLIEPIGKGVLGADIRQTVRSPMGNPCGSILWESKRTKAWSDGWVAKLKNDLIADKAHIPAIISEVLPEEARSGMGQKDGVWVASPKLALTLALLLRNQLLAVAKQKKIAENQQTKAEGLYSYVTSHEFQHQMEAMIETYMEMRQQIQKERNAFERSWKMREQQVERLLSGVSGIYGSMQGIAGQALPPVKGLDFIDGVEADAEDLKLLQ